MKTFTSSIALVLSGLVVSGCVWRVRSDSETASNPGATAPQEGTPAPSSPPATPSPAPSTPAPAPTSSSPSPAPTTPAPTPSKPPRLTPVPITPTPRPPTPPPRTPPVLSGPVAPAPVRPPGDYHQTPAPAPTVTPSPPPKGKGGPDAAKLDTAIGMAAGMKKGAPLALWVWADAPGEKWHVRSTTIPKDLHRFTGRIFVNEGSLLDARGYALDGQDRLTSNPREINLTFDTEGAIDGVDFTLSGAECVLFDFLVDGKAQPLLINIGPRPYHPGSADFRLCK